MHQNNALTPEPALYTLSRRMLWYMFHIPKTLVVLCATVTILGYGMSIVKSRGLQCESTWQLLYHCVQCRKPGPTYKTSISYMQTLFLKVTVITLCHLDVNICVQINIVLYMRIKIKPKLMNCAYVDYPLIALIIIVHILYSFIINNV